MQTIDLLQPESDAREVNKRVLGIKSFCLQTCQNQRTTEKKERERRTLIWVELEVKSPVIAI